MLSPVHQPSEHAIKLYQRRFDLSNEAVKRKNGETLLAQWSAKRKKPAMMTDSTPQATTLMCGKCGNISSMVLKASDGLYVVPRQTSMNTPEERDQVVNEVVSFLASLIQDDVV